MQLLDRGLGITHERRLCDLQFEAPEVDAGLDGQHAQFPDEVAIGELRRAQIDRHRGDRRAFSGQRLTVDATVESTHWPNSRMRPDSSATETNSSGATLPSSGSFHRHKASTATTPPCSSAICG